MAKIGLKYPVYAVASESSSAISYSGGAVFAEAVSASISIEVNGAKFFSNDALRQSDNAFKSGSISIEIDDLSDAVKVAVLGNTEGAEVDAAIGTKEISSSSANGPISIGFGFYGKKMVGSATRWRAIWLKKVQFKEPKDDMKTKGESTEFLSESLEGEIYEAIDGKWKEEGTFSTESGAIAWLNAKSGISSSASNNLSALAFSNGTLTPSFAAGTYNYSCALTDTPTVITATFAAGTAKVYVDGTYNQSLTSESPSAGIAVTDGANKLIEIVVQESGKTAKTYRIMAQNAA